MIALQIFIVVCILIAIYLTVSEEFKYKYSKNRKIRTCKTCGNTQTLVSNEWILNKKPCKNCEL